MIANATGCSSIYGGNLPTTPWGTNADGRGPAWSNSLFEDNAEFGLGIRLGLDQQRHLATSLLTRLAPRIGDQLVTELLAGADASDEVGIAAQRSAVEALRRRLRDVDGDDAALARHLGTVAGSLVRRDVWIVGGDGWAYDIGFGGLDHVLASGEDVNVLVLDTEVYSNTGGQASKATPRGAVAKFATSGKSTPKKDLAMLAVQYGHVYVAKIALGADEMQTLRAFREAEAWPGPSLLLAYSTCIAHGVDMRHSMRRMDLAVKTGYWPLFRYHPDEQGDRPFRLDSKAPSLPLSDLLSTEARYAVLAATDPERAGSLATLAQADVDRAVALLRTAGRRRTSSRPARPRSRGGTDRRGARTVTTPDDPMTPPAAPGDAPWDLDAEAWSELLSGPGRAVPVGDAAAAAPSLATSYLGLELRSPLVASSSPMTADLSALRALDAAGVGAVVLPSLFEEQVEHELGQIEHLGREGHGVHAEAPTGYRPRLDGYNTGAVRYLELVRAAKRTVAVPVIASLNGTTPGGWLRFSQAVADAGADAVEVNILRVVAEAATSGREVEGDALEVVESVARAVGAAGGGQARAGMVRATELRAPSGRRRSRRARALRPSAAPRGRPDHARGPVGLRPVPPDGARGTAALDRDPAGPGRRVPGRQRGCPGRTGRRGARARGRRRGHAHLRVARTRTGPDRCGRRRPVDLAAGPRVHQRRRCQGETQPGTRRGSTGLPTLAVPDGSDRLREHVPQLTGVGWPTRPTGSAP